MGGKGIVTGEGSGSFPCQKGFKRNDVKDEEEMTGILRARTARQVSLSLHLRSLLP